MDDKERGRWGDTRERDTRAASPLIGIILLFALVMMGAMLVFVAGSAMFDALESETNREQAYLCASETDHRLGTVAKTGHDQPLDFDNPRCQPDIAGDGSIELVWYNSSTEDPPWNNGDRNVSGELGALEFKLDDRTIVHQGGGIWEYTGDETTVVSEPDIGYDGDSLHLNIMQLGSASIEGRERVARADYSKSTKLSEKISEAAASSPDGTDVAFRIESTYYDGWEQYLESELGDEAEVTTDPTNETVTVKIKNVRDPFDPATFIVVEDRGLMDKHGNPLDQRVAANRTNAPYRIGGIIENTGERRDDRTINVSIWDKGLNNVIVTKKKKNLKLNPGERANLGQSGSHIQFQHNNEFDDKLQPGETYAYTIEIETDDGTVEDELDDPGVFYYGEPDPHFNLSNVSALNATETGTGNVTISADVQQIGVENTTDRDIGLELDHEDGTPDVYKNIAPVTASGTYGASTSVEWTMNASKMLQGEHEYTIDTGDMTDTRTFTVESGVDPKKSEIYLNPGTEVNVSVLGTEISSEGPARRCVDRGIWGCYEYEDIKRYGEIDGEERNYQVYEKRWAPVTVDIITRPVDEDGNLGARNVTKPAQWGNTGYGTDGSPENRNLNTHDTRDKVWNYSFTTEERVSLTLSPTLYNCGPGGSNYGHQGTDTYTDGESFGDDGTWSNYDGNGYWNHYDCTDTTGVAREVDATTGSNKANVRVRNSENNTIPELRAGHQRQQSADEVLGRGDRQLFGEELEDGTGTLDLEEGKEFVFLFEMTDDASGTDSDEYWEQAKNTDTSGDPNFNDVIVLVEVDGIPEELEAPAPVDPDNELVDVKAGDSDSNIDNNLGSPNETGVEVSTDHIVIG